jgi:hypothetical protein
MYRELVSKAACALSRLPLGSCQAAEHSLKAASHSLQEVAQPQPATQPTQQASRYQATPQGTCDLSLVGGQLQVQRQANKPGFQSSGTASDFSDQVLLTASTSNSTCLCHHCLAIQDSGYPSSS